MSEQLAFDFGPLVHPEYTKGLTKGERFEIFHAANPQVARALEALAAEWLANRSKVSAKALYERLRWESGIRTQGDVWKLNNNFTAYYARLLVERRPEWADAFDLREQKAA